VGRRRYGWLFAAPSFGALVASVIMVRQADRTDRRGVVLLWSVASYGWPRSSSGCRTFSG
jgi:MFS family permease